jgi:hypothetical protein
MRSGEGNPKSALPGYHPYVATGDFNRDGDVDFAVVLINRSKRIAPFALIVFNGPYGEETAEPNYFKDGLDLKNHGLFYGPPLFYPYSLLVGRFYSDTDFILAPSAKTYTMK